MVEIYKQKEKGIQNFIFFYRITMYFKVSAESVCVSMHFLMSEQTLTHFRRTTKYFKENLEKGIFAGEEGFNLGKHQN